MLLNYAKEMKKADKYEEGKGSSPVIASGR